MNHSIHTLELSKELTQDEFNRLISSKNTTMISNTYSEKGVSIRKYHYKSDKLREEGINLTLVQNARNQTKPFCKYYVYFRIDPNKVIGISSYYDIIYPEYIMEFIKRCRKLLRKLGVIQKTLDELILHRIDLCVNAAIKTEAAFYITQAHRLPLPKGFKETYTKELKKKCQYNTKASFDKTNESRGVHISLYDKIQAIPKEYQLTSAEREDILKQPHKYLRLEVRLLRKYIREHENTYHYNTEELIAYFADNSERLIQNEAGKIFFRTGAIVTANTARHYVQQRVYNRRKSEMMLDCIAGLQKYYTFNAAYEKFCLDYSKRKKKLLEDFYEIGISPIPIGVNTGIKFLYSYGYIFGMHSVHQQLREDRIQEDIRKKVM